MRVVIDTNVLVSAILKDRDPETVILFVAESDDAEWIVSPEIMTEGETMRVASTFFTKGETMRVASTFFTKWNEVP